MSWTPERIERLRQLWDEGFSTGEIAKTFGDVTRNAVSGAVFRLKLNAGAGTVRLQKNVQWAGKRAGFARQPANKPTRQPAQPRSRATQHPSLPRPFHEASPVGSPTQEPAVKLAGNGAVFVEPVARPSRAAAAVPEAIGPTARPLAELGRQMCRWGMNDPGRGRMDETLFCGVRVEDGPYCSHHTRKSRQPLAPGRPRTGNELARSLRRYV